MPNQRRPRSSEPPTVTTAQKARAKRILQALRKRYPDAHCELTYTTAHELLVATILSAQSTDRAVNKVTPTLFSAFPSPLDYAKTTPEKIQPLIKTIGLFRNKAKSIHASMTRIQEVFDGQVPNNMQDLLTLRGVARKTANVVLGNAYDINVGVVVDTHVSRLANRFNLSQQSRPDLIEQDLMALFRRDDWTDLSHLLIFHGRQVCKARGATCRDDAICKHYCSNASSSC
ncbi:MAG: endonuclease III [Phycisphaerales bacterium]|nr:endonuclease III [Phycisphaerales bacterium]